MTASRIFLERMLFGNIWNELKILDKSNIYETLPSKSVIFNILFKGLDIVRIIVAKFSIIQINEGGFNGINRSAVI